MPKKTMIHELLAVEQSLSEQAVRVHKDAVKTLSTKRTIFEGLVKSHERFNDEEQHLVMPTEHKEVTTSVDAEMDYLGTQLTRYWDCFLQKESANQTAHADIIVDGAVLASRVPAIVLLAMEKKLAGLISLFSAIPTLDAATTWEVAPGQADGVFQTKHATERQQTTSEDEYVTIVKATDKHPAQVVKQQKVAVVGKYTQTNFSACIASVDKAERIMRLQQLIRAVKQARQRANVAEVNNSLKFGDAIWSFINKG
jgi:hypothetical protein